VITGAASGSGAFGALPDGAESAQLSAWLAWLHLRTGSTLCRSCGD